MNKTKRSNAVPGLATVVALALLAVGNAATHAQQPLFTFGDSEGPARVESAVAVPGGEMGPNVNTQHRIRIDANLLRSGSLILSLPSMDGRTTSLKRLHFETRADGDVLWAGAPLSAHYESALFTVHGDSVIGNYEIDGVRYSLATLDGVGSVAETGDPPGEWCDVLEERVHRIPPGMKPVVKPMRAVQAAKDPDGGWIDQYIDIAFVVTPTAVGRMEYADHGGVGVDPTIQSLVDYGNQVLRNSDINTRLRIAGKETSPSWLMDLMKHPYFSIGWQMPALQAIRQAHDADLVHMIVLNHHDLMSWEGLNGVVCGMNNIYLRALLSHKLSCRDECELTCAGRWPRMLDQEQVTK